MKRVSRCPFVNNFVFVAVILPVFPLTKNFNLISADNTQRMIMVNIIRSHATKLTGSDGRVKSIIQTRDAGQRDCAFSDIYVAQPAYLGGHNSPCKRP